jgi:MFS family permease
VLITAGLLLLAVATTRSGLILSAIVFGTGFGTAYPVFAAYVTHGVREDRRGAAFGAILAAFDTGIGTGSSSLGWLVAHFGYGTAFGIAAALSALALPAFFFADRQVGLQPTSTTSPTGVTAERPAPMT